MQPQKHQALIIAWANGEKIQYRKPDAKEWKDSDTPAWVEDYEYRVKPKEPERPISQMTEEEIRKLLVQNRGLCESTTIARIIANAALRHAIDNGQVVTREEFSRMYAELSKTQRDLTLLLRSPSLTQGK